MKISTWGEVEAFCVALDASKNARTWIKRNGQWSPIVSVKVINDRVQDFAGMPNPEIVSWSQFVDQDLKFSMDPSKYRMEPPEESEYVRHLTSVRDALALLYAWGYRKSGEPIKYPESWTKALAVQIMNLIPCWEGKTRVLPTGDGGRSEFRLVKRMSNGPVEVYRSF